MQFACSPCVPVWRKLEIVRRCECYCVSLWPCDELATCPGCHPTLAWDRPPETQLTLSSGRSGYWKWMDGSSYNSQDSSTEQFHWTWMLFPSEMSTRLWILFLSVPCSAAPEDDASTAHLTPAASAASGVSLSTASVQQIRRQAVWCSKQKGLKASLLF